MRTLASPKHWEGFNRPDPEGEEETVTMLRIVVHRRECHLVAHMGCKGVLVKGKDGKFRKLICRPGADGNCRGCKDEYVPAVVRYRRDLLKEADRILREGKTVDRTDADRCSASRGPIVLVGGLVEVGADA